MKAVHTVPDMELLTAALSPVQPTDTITAAGRKIILADTIRLMTLEDGTRAGSDPEFVHDMRVATRRMRSLLRLLEPYYRRKTVKRLNRALRWLGRSLGAVRDLDVLLADLHARDGEALHGTIRAIQARRDKAHHKLVGALDSKDYRALLNGLAGFALDFSDSLDGYAPDPVEVRHIVPVILHQQLANVRGFDPLLVDSGAPPDFDALHALRITFKRLRYATQYFAGVLGASAEPFIKEIKAVQDHLGRLNDVVSFEAYLMEHSASLDEDDPALTATLDALRAEADLLTKSFVHAWNRFNSRSVQKHLADALLVLR